MIATEQRSVGFSGGLSFPFTSPQPYPFFSIAWMAMAYEVTNDGTKVPIPPASLVLEVTILTDPPVSGDVIQRLYAINAEGNVDELQSTPT